MPLQRLHLCLPTRHAHQLTPLPSQLPQLPSIQQRRLRYNRYETIRRPPHAQLLPCMRHGALWLIRAAAIPMNENAISGMITSRFPNLEDMGMRERGGRGLHKVGADALRLSVLLLTQILQRHIGWQGPGCYQAAG